jgi:hypothetical protein
MSLHVCAWADSGDEGVGDEHRSIFDNCDIGERSAATGSAATQS